jgi:translation elongation factor EF-G
MPQDPSRVRISIPDAIEAEVMLQLNRLGGMITSIEQETASRTAIDGTIPKKHIGDFKAWLDSFSSGQGSVTQGPT